MKISKTAKKFKLEKLQNSNGYFSEINVTNYQQHLISCDSISTTHTSKSQNRRVTDRTNFQIPVPITALCFYFVALKLLSLSLSKWQRTMKLWVFKMLGTEKGQKERILREKRRVHRILDSPESEASDPFQSLNLRSLSLSLSL